MVADQLGGEEAIWRVECSGGRHPLHLFNLKFKVCHCEQMLSNGRRETCAIEGRAIVQNLWRQTKVDKVSRKARGEELDLLLQKNLWIDEEGRL